MPAFLRRAAITLALVLLAACGDPTVAEMVEKTANANTKADLERLLGKPHEISKLGPVETWTYKARDGQVSFLITGDTVQMSAGGSRR